MKNIENYLYEEAYIFNKALISQLTAKSERGQLRPLSPQTGGGCKLDYNKG